jgi:hypothetical protein
MAKKRNHGLRPGDVSVTADRFRRLYRLVGLLAEGTHRRPVLLRRLRQDVRGFYRDLETLRKAGIRVRVLEGRYVLDGDVETARALLPWPDPHLTLGEIRQLARGRTAVHQKLARQVEDLTS